MVDERDENLQPADGMNESAETQNNSAKIEQADEDVLKTEENSEISEKTPDLEADNDSLKLLSEKSVDEIVDEIEQSMAVESEKDKEQHEEHIPFLSYKNFDIPTLLNEAKKLLETHPVQKIKKHFDTIKTVFEDKVDVLTEQYKKENPNASEVDLYIPEINELKYIIKDYKVKLQAYRKEVQKRLEENLKKRQALIEELKHIIDSPEYGFDERIKKYKEIKKQWRKAGSIPRSRYTDIWETFKHHEERFHDLLDLDKDYRNKVFKENLEQKQAIIEEAKKLLDYDDVHRAFKELQKLHKKWKEETGPVAREYREKIWEEFKNITKQIHDKRRDFYKKLKEEFAQNLVKKQEIIEKLKEITAEIPENHKEWQQKIKEVEDLREQFYKIGFVPKKNREEIWSSFKTVIKDFNKHKNNFYKTLKELQKENLDKKMTLIKIAEELKDSEDWETTTQKFKEIQEEWKKIGHVPRKYSEKIWKQFRDACNHYFDRYHAHIRSEKDEEYNNFIKKKEYLNTLKEQFKDVDNTAGYTIEDIQNIISEWKKLGYVPDKKQYINVKFNKFINSLYDKLQIDKRELSFIKFKNIVDQFYEEGNFRKLDSEKRYVRQKIENISKEIEQLENNMLFIKSNNENNPIKKEVERKIEKNKEILEFWKKKLQYLNSLEY